MWHKEPAYGASASMMIAPLTGLTFKIVRVYMRGLCRQDCRCSWPLWATPPIVVCLVPTIRAAVVSCNTITIDHWKDCIATAPLSKYGISLLLFFFLLSHLYMALILELNHFRLISGESMLSDLHANHTPNTAQHLQSTITGLLIRRLVARGQCWSTWWGIAKEWVINGRQCYCCK